VCTCVLVYLFTSSKYPPIQIRFQQPVRVTALLQFPKFCHRLLAVKGARSLGGGFAVLGKVEAPARGEHDAVEILCQFVETGTVRVRDLEIHRQRETVHGVGEEKIVGAVTFGHAEVRGESALFGEGQRLGPCGKRCFLRQKTLVLDQSAAPVGKFPVRNVVQQKMKSRVALSERVAAQAGDVLGGVDAPRPKVVHEGRHEIMEQAFGHHAKEAARQGLVRQLHGLPRFGVFALVQIIGGVDLSVADRDAVQPADDVIELRRVAFENLQMFGQRARRQRMHFEQAGVHLLHLHRDRSENAQHPQSADHGVEQVGVFLRGAGDFRAGGQNGGELGDVLADRPHAEVVLPMDVRGETASQRGGHRARDDGRPPTIRQDLRPQLAERHPRLASHLTGSRVPFEDLVHRGQVQHNPAAVHGRVVVTASRAARGDGESVPFGELEGFVDVVRGARLNYVRLRPQGVAEIFEGGEGWVHVEEIVTLNVQQ